MNLTASNKFIDFVTSGYKEKCYWEIRNISKDGNVISIFFYNGEELKKYLEINQSSLSTVNCFLGVNPRISKTRGDDSVKFTNILFVDLDSPKAIEDNEKIYSRLNELGLPPSLIANSGHGTHNYWKLSETINSELWVELQKALIELFKVNFPEYNPDGNIKNPERVMRLIGTMNIKDVPVETSILKEGNNLIEVSTIENILEPFVEEKIEREIRPQNISLTKELSNEQTEKLANLVSPLWIKGHRNQMQISLTGTLMKEGFTINSIKRLIEKICDSTSDEERESRIRNVTYHEKFEDLSQLLGSSGLYKEFLSLIGVKDAANAIISKIKETIREIPLENELPVICASALNNIKISPVEWAIEGYVPKKGINFWAGKRSSYKSLLALYTAICITLEKAIFGKFNVAKSSVLYIDEENGLEVIKERIVEIANGMGVDIKELNNLFFVSYESIKLEVNVWRDKIKNFLKSHSPCVIIVDSFRRVITAEENDAGEINKVFTECIRPIIQEFDCTWILIHHLRKTASGGRMFDDSMDEIRGSSEFANVSDSIIILDRPPKAQNRFIMRQVKCRRSKEQPPYIVEVEWSNDNVIFKPIGIAEEILDNIDMCSKDILVWLEEKGIVEFKTKDVRDEMKKGDYSKSTVDRSLNALVMQGKIMKPKRGVFVRITNTLVDSIRPKDQEVQESNGPLANEGPKDPIY